MIWLGMWIKEAFEDLMEELFANRSDAAVEVEQPSSPIATAGDLARAVWGAQTSLSGPTEARNIGR